MANRLKKKIDEKPAQKEDTDFKPFKSEKEEKVDLKQLARDERTWTRLPK